MDKPIKVCIDILTIVGHIFCDSINRLYDASGRECSQRSPHGITTKKTAEKQSFLLSEKVKFFPISMGRNGIIR